jgi:PAS domain S-box-containing protein
MDQIERLLQQNLRRLLENVQEFSAILDPQGTILHVHRTPARPADLIGTHICSRVLSDYRDALSAALTRAVQTGQVQTCEVVGTFTGSHYLARLIPIVEDGRVVAVVVFGGDISEQRRIEEDVRAALGARESHYRALVEAVPDMVFHLDKEGRFLSFVPVPGQRLLAPPSEFLGRTVHDVLPADIARGAMRTIERALSAGETLVAEFRIPVPFPDGDPRDYEARMSRSGTDEVIAVVRDVTSTLRTQRALRESEERLRSLVTNAPVIMFAIDSQGVFTAAEGKAVSLVGPSPEEHIGRSVFDMYRDLPGVIDAARRALAGEAFTTIVELQTLTFEAHVTPVWDGDGKIKGAVAVATDITERARVEKALKESEERFRRLAEDSIDGIALSEGPDVRFVNAALVKMLGYESKEEIIGRPFTDFVSPEHRDMMAERGRARAKGQEVPDRYEFRALRRDGSEFDAETAVSRITYQGDQARLGLIRDVTERKRAEEAIRDSERRYRLLAENLTDVIWTSDLKLNLTYVSPSISWLVGYTAEESMKLTFQEVLTPASLEFITKVYAEDRALERLEQRDPHWSRMLELEVYRKDGSIIWVEANMAFLRDRDGRAVGFLGVARDVTARKRAEEALRHSEARFRKLADSAAAAVFIYRGTRPLFVNAATAELTGYTREEILANELWQFVHPDFQALVRERSRARQQGAEAPLRYEFSVVRKSGEERWVDFTATMVEFEGEPAALGTAYDITERKQAEEALRESEERFRRLSQATHEGIVIHEGGLLLDANPQAAALLGYELQEIIGRDAFSLIAPESHDLVRQNMATGYEEPYEVLVLRKDGTPLPVEVCGKAALYQGRPVRVGCLRDISARKRAEEALQTQRDELETRAELRMETARRYKLTFRELTVLYLVAGGMADKEIAFRLGISHRTASKHVENILSKMGAMSRTEAGVRAIQEGLVESLR